MVNDLNITMTLPLQIPEKRPGWWEVDLGHEMRIEAIDVYGASKPNTEGKYPPILASLNRLAPFVLRLYSTTWAVIGQKTFKSNATAVFSWAKVDLRAR
jgi:hypothetical protein